MASMNSPSVTQIDGNDTSRPDDAPQVDAPLLVALPLTKTVAPVVALGYNSHTGLFVGTLTANGHYATSPDLATWTDRTYSPSTYTPTVYGYHFDADYQYAVTQLGKVFRSAHGVYNAWTDVSVATRPAGTLSLQGANFAALGSGRLLFGNYSDSTTEGAHVWLSTDAGATWTEVLNSSTAKHVHAIKRSPTTGYVWATVGDAGFVGSGIWRSTDAGTTWEHVSSNDYGIDMEFVTSAYGDLVVMEGDGLNRPLLMGLREDATAGSKTFPLAWFTGPPSDAASTRGTTRGIAKTAAGHIVFSTTTESGAVGTHSGLYVAQAPDYTRLVLLADTTGAEPVAYLRTFISGSVMQNYLWQYTVPTFGSY